MTWSLQANIKRICTAKSQYLLFLAPVQKWTSGVVRLGTAVNNGLFVQVDERERVFKVFLSDIFWVASQYSARPLSSWMCMLLLSDDLGSKNGLVWYSLCVGSGGYSEVNGLEISRLVNLGPTECGRPCEPMEKCYGRKLGILNSCKIIGFLPLSYASRRKKLRMMIDLLRMRHTRSSMLSMPEASQLQKCNSPEEGLEPSTLRFIFKSLTR